MDRNNFVKFNSFKTQLLPISFSKIPSNFPVFFDGSVVSPVDNINILDLNMNKKMSWKTHITTVARAASRNWKFCLDCETFLLFSVAPLYKGLIRQCMEYCSHIWGGLWFHPAFGQGLVKGQKTYKLFRTCLLYTSDAADERSSVDLGGRRIIKKKKTQYTPYNQK